MASSSPLNSSHQSLSAAPQLPPGVILPALPLHLTRQKASGWPTRIKQQPLPSPLRNSIATKDDEHDSDKDLYATDDVDMDVDTPSISESSSPRFNYHASSTARNISGR